jgi:small ligand-binding sensory domain FIST
VKAAASIVEGVASAGEAAERAAAEALQELGGEPELAVAFASAEYWRAAEEVVSVLGGALAGVPTVGCVAEGVVGTGREAHEGKALSLWLARGFSRPVETFAVEYLGTASGGLFAGHRFEAGGGAYLFFADPFSFPVMELLEHLNSNVPGAFLAGGLVSGGVQRQASELFLDGSVLRAGAVGAHLAGAEVDLVVSEACRPIGNPYTVTRAERNLVYEMGGRPAYERLERLVASLPDEDKGLLASGGLQFGIVMDEYRETLGQDDFLARAVLGADPAKGTVLVAGEVEVGRTVQFLARDPAAADRSLAECLEREAEALSGRPPAGVLLFPCNGRGPRLFSEPDHDAAMVKKVFGSVPAAGFFAAGELGPYAGKNYLHAFSASMAIFR